MLSDDCSEFLRLCREEGLFRRNKDKGLALRVRELRERATHYQQPQFEPYYTDNERERVIAACDKVLRSRLSTGSLRDLVGLAQQLDYAKLDQPASE